MSTAGVVREPMGVRDSRRLLVERAAVLLGCVFRSVGRGWSRWRKQARRNRAAEHGGGLGMVVGAVMGRALAARGANGRMLAVEERLTLGPKQHMYLIRCGEQRLLVASAGEAALQWMTLPGETAQVSGEACANTLVAEGNSGAGIAAKAKRRAESARGKAQGAGRGAASRVKTGRSETGRAEAEGAR